MLFLIIQLKFRFGSLKLEISLLKMNHVFAVLLNWLLKQIIEQNRSVSTWTIALEISSSQNPIVSFLNRINLRFNFNRWLPHDLTAEDKRKRKILCLVRVSYQRLENISEELWPFVKNGCIRVIQIVNKGGQPLWNQQDRLQGVPKLTSRSFFAFFPEGEGGGLSWNFS